MLFWCSGMIGPSVSIMTGILATLIMLFSKPYVTAFPGPFYLEF